MRKKLKRLMGIILTLAIVVGMMPEMSLTVLADGESSYANLKNTATVVKFDNKDWYLIGFDDSTVTLLSKECVGASAYNSSDSYVEYANSTVKKEVDNWYSNNITEGAKTAVNGGGMFLLSTDEANSLSADVLKRQQASGAEYNYWWLCSSGDGGNKAACVDGDTGNVDSYGTYVDKKLGVRPALKLDLSKVMFDSDTDTFSLGAAESTYTITVNSTTNGTVTALNLNGDTITTATTGAVVQLNIEPLDGYELDVLTIKDSNENDVSLMGDAGPSDYAFGMPASNVTVSATFKETELVAEYPLWVGGTQVTSENMNDVFGDSKVSYTPAEDETPAVLTLNGYSYSGAGYTAGSSVNAAIYAEQDLTISLTGDNNTVTHTPVEDRTSAGVYVSGKLTITGSGTLTANGGNVTKRKNSYGVYSSKLLTIDKGTTVKANSGDCDKSYSSPGNSKGLYGGSGMEINGTVEAKSGFGSISSAVEVYSTTNMIIGADGSVNAIAGEASGSISAGVKDAKLTVNGLLTAAGGKSQKNSYGLYVLSLNVSGTLEAAGGEKGEGCYSLGAYVGRSDEFTVTGGTVAAKGHDFAVSTSKVVDNTSMIAAYEYTVQGGQTVTESVNYDGSNATTVAVSNKTAADSKYVKIEPHTHDHDWNYALSTEGATITATCSKDDCDLPVVDGKHVATLTIEAIGGTYDDVNSFGATITDENSIKGTAGVEYFKATANGERGESLTEAPKNAGKYWAEITLGTDDNKATAHVVYDVAKADPTISTAPTASAITYGQKLSSSNLTGGEASVAGGFAWKDDTIAPAVSDSQTTGYDVVFTPGDTDNYNTAECQVKLTVNPKEIGLLWTDTELTYNGQVQAPKAAATGLVSGDEGKVNVSVTGGETNASTETYTATASELTGDKSGNYTLPSGNTTAFTISPKSITEAVVTLDKTELTYTGSEQSVSVIAVSLDGVSLTATDYTVSGNTGTNKDNYTVTITGTGNYKDVATADWKIVAKAMTVTAEPVSETYDGNKYGITVNVTDPSSETTSVKYGTEDGTYDLNESPKFKDAGTHTVYFKVSGNDDYSDYEGSATVTISKKTVTANVTAEDKPYDGKTDATVTASVPTEVLVSGDSIEITGLKGSFADVNVGTDKVVTVDSSAKSISGNGSGNYEVTIPSETTASISKSEPKVTAPGVETLTYNGEAQELVTAGTVTGGKMYYAVTTEDKAPTDESLYTTSIPTATDAGTYFVWYKVKGDDNHSDSDAKCVTVTVKCVVKFVDEDGTTVLKEATGYEKGTKADKIVKPADPTKAATAEYTYTFAGWTPEITDVTANETTYKATYKETKNKYTVTFNSNEGSAVASQTVEYGVKAAIPEKPVKEGCVFSGWYADEALTKVFDFETSIAENITLYAKWEKQVAGVSVTPSEVKLTKAGDTSQINVTVAPADAANTKVTYKSGDTKVATVDENGKITAVANGTTDITVTTEDGGKTATVKVTVAIPDVPKQEEREEPKTSEEPAKEEKAAISMNAGLKISQTGSKINIKWGKVSEADGYDVYVAYCGNEFGKAVKTVKKNSTTSVNVTKINGKKINLKKNYKIYVTAYKMVDGKKVKLAKSIMGHVVGRLNTKYSNAKDITLSKSKYTVKAGKTAKVKAKTVLADKSKKQLSDAHAAEFRYATSDKNIATVDKNGKIKGVAKGTCTIYVYARNGYAKEIKVTVKK